MRHHHVPGKWKENLGLKILSVVIAIVIWYVVVRYDDPVITRSYNVKVTVTNEAYIKSGKQIYTIDDSYKSVTVYIKGNRSTIRKIDDSDITVTADLTQIVDLNTTPVMVPLSVSVSGVDQGNITLSRTTIPITIENVASKEYTLTVDTGDSSPGKEYEVGKMTPNPEQVIINGPESIVNQIESIVAEIDVTGMTENGSKKADLHLFDKNQTELSSDTISNDITFDGGEPSVSVYVELWKKQSNIGFDIQYSGTPASGYEVIGTKATPETITIAGSDDALEKLSEEGNKITIPESELSVAGASSDITKNIDLTDLLPDDTKLSSNTADTLSVTITILPSGSRELQLDVDDIKLNNLGDGLTVTYDQTNVPIQVSGDSSAVENLQTSDISASIDLKDKGKGDYTVPVDVTLPDGVKLANDVEIQVHLIEAAETSGSSD